jgi:uncharacterized protein DUF3108
LRLRHWKLLVILLLLMLPLPRGLFAQTMPASERALAPVPFGPGERMTYSVKLGFLGEVGNGILEVISIDTVHGYRAYQLRMYVKGGVAFAKVQNEYKSWLDLQSLIARRFYQNVKEVDYKRKRMLEFFPAERRWQCVGDNLKCVDKMESGPMPTDEPLDDLSFLFYARTLPLVVGEEYSLPRYWKDEGNPVTVKVLRRDTISVPAGKFATIVVQPIIRTKGLFSEGGRAEVFLSDDDRRIPVLIKTRLDVPLVKSLNMFLQTYSPGARVAPPFTVRTATGN